MKLESIQPIKETGAIKLFYKRVNQDDYIHDGQFDPTLGPIHIIDITKGSKNALVENLGQQLADAIEAQYWGE